MINFTGFAAPVIGAAVLGAACASCITCSNCVCNQCASCDNCTCNSCPGNKESSTNHVRDQNHTNLQIGNYNTGKQSAIDNAN